jgi:hypothetical protein
MAGIFHGRLALPSSVVVTRGKPPSVLHARLIDWALPLDDGFTNVDDDSSCWRGSRAAQSDHAPTIAELQRGDMYSLACLAYFILWQGRRHGLP